jgi:outer membrane protein assembly factor BamB
VLVTAVALAACSSSKSTSTSTSSRATTTTASAASSATTAPTTGAAADWPTYHHDPARTGRVSTGPGPSVHRVWSSPALDGDVYAEPVVANGIIVTATENDSVFGFASDTGAQRWKTHLGEPIPGNQLPCGNIDPSGITSTPAIDSARGVVYVAAFLQPAHHELVALDLTTGAVRWRTTIDPRGANPKTEQQRSALSLDGDEVVVPFGGLFGDCGDYHGYVVTVGADGSGIRATYMVPAARAAAVWAPPGATTDANGDLYVTSGNATESPQSDDLSDSVIRLSRTLAFVGAFTPTNRVALSQSDADLGSVSPALLDGRRLFQVGKQGVGYLLDADHLAGSATVHQGKVCGSAYGGTAYAPPLLFVPCRDGLVALRTSPTTFDVAWHTASFDAGPPVVGGSTVWSIDLSDEALVAFDASSGRELSHVSLGNLQHFTTPTILGNRVLVAAGGHVDAYGS